jgi:hypothetical protein
VTGQQPLPPHPGRLWAVSLLVRVLPVLLHLRTSLTTCALAALFGTSQSTLATSSITWCRCWSKRDSPIRPAASGPWIIDGTLIPVHDQSITAIDKNYARSVNTQIIICAHPRRVLAAARCWPGNRNDKFVARHAVAQLLDDHTVLGDGGDRGIASITTPRRDHAGQIIREDHYRAHHRIRAHIEHIIARLNDWQILRQCRRRAEPIKHSLQIIATLWNFNNHKQLRINS